MEDDLSLLGVSPSDRKKLESMGITTLEQIAVMSPQTLGMGPAKSSMLIQRARNIIANNNILDINIKDDDTIEVEIKRIDRAIRKSIANAFDVLISGWGNAAIETKDNRLILKRKSSRFDRVLQRAKELQELFEAKRIEEREKLGIYLPEDELIEFARKRGFEGFWKNVFQEIHGNDIMKKVIATNKPVLLADVEKDSDFDIFISFK